MPTNDERREVAARLRETILTEGAAVIEERKGLEPAVASRFVAIPNLVAALNFDKAIVSMRELTDRLADLIEPEPERTCKMELVKSGPIYRVWRFSCCGYEHSENVTDGGATELPGTRCPKCGAVVNDER